MARSRLLVIDDHPNFRNYVARVAKQCGYDVKLAGDKAKFEKLCDSFAPHLVMLDPQLSTCDGMDLIEWLAARPQSPRLLAVSACGESYLEAAETLAVLRGLPWFKALAKPVGLTDLRAALLAAKDARDKPPAESVQRCGQNYAAVAQQDESPILTCARCLSELHNRFGENEVPDFQEAVAHIEKEIARQQAGSLAEAAIQLMLSVVYLERMREDVVVDVVETTLSLQGLLSSVLERIAEEAGIDLGEFGGDWYISPETLRAFGALRGLKRLHA